MSCRYVMWIWYVNFYVNIFVNIKYWRFHSPFFCHVFPTTSFFQVRSAGLEAGAVRGLQALRATLLLTFETASSGELQEVREVEGEVEWRWEKLSKRWEVKVRKERCRFRRVFFHLFLFKSPFCTDCIWIEFLFCDIFVSFDHFNPPLSIFVFAPRGSADHPAIGQRWTCRWRSVGATLAQALSEAVSLAFGKTWLCKGSCSSQVVFCVCLAVFLRKTEVGKHLCQAWTVHSVLAPTTNQ